MLGESLGNRDAVLNTPYVVILLLTGTELYNKLSESKVIKEAAIRSGVSVGVMQVCWDAAGEVIKAWCTEGQRRIQSKLKI